MDLENFRKEFVKAAKSLPMIYSNECEMREWKEMGIGPVGQHRDSDPLEKSNFRIICADLMERFSNKVDILRFGHFGVGWVEEIAFDSSDDEVVKAVVAWGKKLENYPVADEDDYSDLEWEENHPTENECYADSDCPCAAAERKRNPPPECEDCGHECSQDCTECGGIPMTKEDEICGICKKNEK